MKALQYGDTVVYPEDLNTLGHGQWLGDRILSFYFEYLENEVHSGCDTICFVSPVVVQLIGSLTTPAESAQFLETMCLESCELVLLPLNDNQNYSVAGGGSHWSLLVYNRREHAFVHYDSMHQKNWRLAVDVVHKLRPTLDREAEATKPICPQQSNGYDCGVYAMVFAAEVAQAFANQREPNLECATPSFVSEFRRTLYDLIVQVGKPCENVS